MTMRRLFTLTWLALATCAAPVWAQKAKPANNSAANTASDETTEEFQFPAKGVRFVICSPTGESLPSPLYVKVEKQYVPVRISSRTPCPRLAPEKGKINFYETEPDPNAKEKPKPYLTINVPPVHSDKSICVVQPRKNGGEPTTYFLREREFERGGVYVVNLSSSELEILISPNGKFEGEDVKVSKIAKFTGDKFEDGANKSSYNITSGMPNVWVYSGGTKQKKRVPFVLRSVAKGSSTESRRISASVMQSLPNLAQVSFVLNHPTAKGSYKLISIQYSDDERLRQAAQREAEKR